MLCSSYLSQSQSGDKPARSAADAAWSVLDAIEAAGPAGADIETLVLRTRYDGDLVNQVLHNLRAAGMTWSTPAMRHRVTSLGETARSLASY